MVGMNLNFGSSLIKREAKPIEDVVNQLKRNGWSQSGSMGERVRYFENSGLSITVIDGPRGTVVLPSGPIRGRLFGESGLMTSDASVIGAGANSNGQKETQDEQAARKVQQHT